MTQTTPTIPILLSVSGQGGVERMVANLAGGLARAGYRVELLVVRDAEALPPMVGGVHVIPLGARHSATAIPALARYLRRERPPALLVAKDRAIRAAVLARRLAGTDTRLVGRLGTHLAASLAHRNPVARAWRRGVMRLFYRSVDRVVAVSEGVAADTRQTTGLPAERISVVRNPAWTPELAARAAQDPEHPWFEADAPPVFVAAGRLTYQKDFATLVRAFARVRARRPCRLLILGEGRDRPMLETLIAELDLAADVALPGFTANPYPYFAQANAVVLSSRWEGSPNVLTEALALGTPVVATDCPSGPSEILAQGRYGPLVPVGDVAGLAEAMEQILDHPPPPDMLEAAAEPYTLQRSVAGYLEALGVETEQSQTKKRGKIEK